MKSEEKLLIHRFVDMALSKMSEMEMMSIINMPCSDMLAKIPEINDGWYEWKAVKSTVTDNEIKEVEGWAGIEFPDSFKELLYYKHFYELLGPNMEEIMFFSHPSNGWTKEYREMYSYDWVVEHLLNEKIIPFAKHQDWGFLCFDARNKIAKNEYPILLVDHELIGDAERYEVYNSSFIEMVDQRLMFK